MALAPVESRYRAAIKTIDRYTEPEPVNLSARVVVAGTGAAFVLGGMLDPVSREYTGPAIEPAIEWTIGEGQLPPFNFASERKVSRFVCVGAMGAGKTEVLARAAVATALEFKNAQIGVVAPTSKRLRIIWKKIRKLMDPSWVVAIRTHEGEIELVNGVTLQFVAAKEYSAAIGSPIQGQDWVAAFVDEEQDVSDDALADVDMRGRDAPDGYYPVLSSCTLKDTPKWRTRLAKYNTQGGTRVYRMESTANPFVAPEYWESLRAKLSPRQYRLRVLALEAPPERAVFPEFTRNRHLRPIPRVGARDITRRFLGGAFDMLIGHDPGKLVQVSEGFKLFDVPGEPDPVWWVVDELTTDGTPEDHAKRLRERLRTRWDLQHEDKRGEGLGQALIIADPYGESDNRPDIGCYRQFRRMGFVIKSASGKKGKPIHREARYQLGNRLLLDAAGRTRCYFAVGDDGAPVCDQLVAALEMAEKDERGDYKPEKGRADQSHWIDAWLYGVWRFERERAQWGVVQTGVAI